MRLTSPFKPSETARNLVTNAEQDAIYYRAMPYRENAGDSRANLLAFIANLENDLRTAQSENRKLQDLLTDICNGYAESKRERMADDEASASFGRSDVPRTTEML